ncbi:kinase-like protein, partial [Aureobasidium melanogenum]|uniref:Kinase-like protein n=1 Tax=Aureobasidium melanogenum (strain CBS 110374) TaxID=1043003 RepID=A0A074WII2_AURM1
MQGLQIRTPANAGSYKIMTETSKKASEDQEMLTPPSTPARAKTTEQFPSRRSLDSCQSRVSELDFTPDLSQAQLLGEGVWSKVYSIPAVPLSQSHNGRPMTPPSTPHKTTFLPPQQYAIKTATRSDAAAVFQAEAEILTHIQNYDSSSDYVVPFVGVCTGTSSPSLLFQRADAGSLESLLESSSNLSLDSTLDLFLHILQQLTHGLYFLHNTTNTIHADIKPANILLSSTSCPSTPTARYADFSTSFVADTTPSSHSGGGTYSFMAPEQLSRDPEASTPTYASDVYSAGITLLSFLCGGNPFSSMLNNGFRLREAVKMGDAMSWAMQEPAFENRVEQLQKVWEERGGEGKILGLVAPALRKKREDRIEAGAWCRKVDAAIAKLNKVESVGLGIRC